jgi:hypothetical protein
MLVSRIISGSIRMKLGTRVFTLMPASPALRYRAQEVHEVHLQKARRAGLFDEDDLLAYLLEQGFWDEEREERVTKLPREIEDFKVALFEHPFRSNERALIRKNLAIAKGELARLESERHAHDGLSIRGAAQIAKGRFLLAMCLRRHGRPLFNEAAYWGYRGNLLEKAAEKLGHLRISEANYRELARTEPWRSVWNGRKASPSVFGVPATRLSDEQRMLVSITLLYDSVYEHPECPNDDVLEDDDLLDGWLIIQRRKRGKNKPAPAREYPQADEVFIPVDTPEDAAAVHDLNDETAKATVQQRFAYLRKKGTVHELEMPDTRQRLKLAINQKLREQVKGTQ